MNSDLKNCFDILGVWKAFILKIFIRGVIIGGAFLTYIYIFNETLNNCNLFVQKKQRVD